MSIVDKIIYLLKINKYNQKNLTEYLGLSEGTISDWKKGKTTSYVKHIDKIAEFFNVPVSYFYDDIPDSLSDDEQSLLDDYRSLTEGGKKYVSDFISDFASIDINRKDYKPTVPIQHSVLKVSAGVGFELLDECNMEDVKVPATPEAYKADFVLTIEGDSMTPKFDDGDDVLVRSQPAVNVGEICIYTIANNGYIKKFGGDRLISLNPEYEDILFSDYDADEIRCCGLVLGKTTIIE